MKTTLQSIEYALRSETYTINAIDEKFDELKNKDSELRDRIDFIQFYTLNAHEQALNRHNKILKENDEEITKNATHIDQMLLLIVIIALWISVSSIYLFNKVSKIDDLEKRLNNIETTTIEEVEP